MRKFSASAVMLFFVFLACCRASDLLVLSAYHRPDPFGGIVASDLPQASWNHAIQLSAARGGYVSFQLVVKSDRPCSDCKLSIESSQPVDVYREWFHFNTPDKHYYPDALIPVHLPYSFQMPDPENAIQGQKVRAFWVDVWIARNAKPGVYHGRARLLDGSARKTVPFTISVLPAQIPAQDVINMDSNSYGVGWLHQQYPKALADSGRAQEDALYQLIHDYHRIFYENRGIYHQLAYGHAGYVDTGFAPELAGTGDQKHIVSWDRFDRLFGPLWMVLRLPAPGADRNPFHSCICRSIQSGRRIICGGMSRDIRRNLRTLWEKWNAISARRAGQRRSSKCSSIRRNDTKDLSGMGMKYGFPKTTATSSLSRSADELVAHG